MNTTAWILTGVLGAAFAVGGVAQLTVPKDRYRAIAASQHWVDDFGPGHLKAIGTIKLLGALGLLLPEVGDIAPFLVPVAACGLALFMAGAATIRFRRSEWTYMAGDMLFIAAFAVLAWMRFDAAPFI